MRHPRSRFRLRRLGALLLVGLLLLWLLGGILPAMAIEEPDYAVLAETERYELRRYAPFVIAEIEIEGSFEGAGRRAFRALFRYIAGDNRGGEKIAMTAPVRQEPGGGEKIEMTAPVLQRSSSRAKRQRVSFVLPREYTLETAPEPDNPQVRLRQVPERLMGVRRYSGTWSERRFRQREAKLISALEADGHQILGPAEWARYNGPFTPWFLRRNEILVEVSPP